MMSSSVSCNQQTRKQWIMFSRLTSATYLSLVLFITFSSLCLGASSSIPSGFTEVRSEKEITEYRLDANGLTVLLLPDHSAPAATVMVTYRVGSRNESYGTTGATHLLEHLMFKGTREHNREAGSGFDQLLERTGAITNATTSQDRTNYFETVGAQDIGLAITLEADRMRNLRLREDDRRPEMTVVRNEYERGENNPAEALEKEMWATAYIAHPYHHSTIGWHSDFEKVPIEKLRAFYETFYWPNNATVTVIGDFEPAAALKLIKQHYGKIPRSTQKIPEVYTEEPPQTGARRLVVQRPGELGVVMIAQKIPPGRSADYAPLRVLGLILSDGRNSRFYKALTDKNLTTGVDADPQFNRDPTLFFVNAELTPGTKHADVEQRILAEIARVAKDGVQADEVAAAIAKYVANTAYQRDGSMAMAFAINECIATGDWRLYYRLQDAIKRTTPVDVQRVAKKYFGEDERTTGWYIPRNEKPKDQVSGAGAVEAGIDTTESPKPESSKSAATGAPESSNSHASKRSKAVIQNEQASGDAVPAAKIAPRIKRSSADGIDLLVCPTGVKDVITIKGVFPAYQPGDEILGDLASDMLERGTTKHDADTIAKLLDRIGAQTGFSYETGHIRFAARCLKKDSAEVIGLLAEQLREPVFPSDEFEKLRKQKLAEAQQLRESTDAQAAIAFCRAIFPVGHPMRRLTPEEKMAALRKATVADVKAYHEKFFGPEHCTMVVVGDVDRQKIEGEVRSAFAEWKGGRPLPKIPPTKPVRAGEELTIKVPGKESVSVIMGVPTGLRYADADHLPLAVATNVLGYGFTSRLVGTVRDTEGLTYGIGAGLSGSGQMEQTWIVNATFAPSLLKQGLASTRRELMKWRHDGITAAELDYRKSSLAGAHRVGLATSSGLAEVILNTIRRGLPLSWIDDYPKKVASLTLEQVNGAIRHHLDPAKLVIARAGTIRDP
jgi:zinc protease